MATVFSLRRCSLLSDFMHLSHMGMTKVLGCVRPGSSGAEELFIKHLFEKINKFSKTLEKAHNPSYGLKEPNSVPSTKICMFIGSVLLSLPLKFPNLGY